METKLGTGKQSGIKLKTLHRTTISKDMDINAYWVDSNAVKRAIVDLEHKTAKALAIIRQLTIL